MEKKYHDFLAMTDLSREEFLGLIEVAIRLKDQTKAGVCPQLLAGKTAGLVFHKPSLRTRISFEVGVNQFGGKSLFITDQEIQLGVRESVADAARVLSRFLDIIIIRTFKQSDVEELARWADIPVINALTDWLHPCQIFCDLLTIREKLGVMEGLKVSYFGDGNNVTRSWINAARLLNIDLWVATSPENHPGREFVANAAAIGRGRITVTEDAQEAARGADVLYGDVWASMGEKNKAAEKAHSLERFQINQALVSKAKEGCLVMHCLPAERGREVTDEVIDGANSVVFDQAENRLHGQKALMLWALGEL